MIGRRAVLLIVAFAVLAVVVALPVLAATPSPSGGAAAASHGPQAKPPKSSKDKPNQADKEDETGVTLTGTVQATTDADGDTGYTLDSAGTTYTLDAGPKWFFGDAYPLAPYVGKSVTITGDSATGSTDVDVLTVDGKALRAPGKPPWAGGWKVVGKAHPGWSQEKADRLNGKSGGCFPPGQCKDKAPEPTPTP
jgi:hypothetical protein